MSQLKPIKPEVLIEFLKKQGFVKVRQKGSHIFFRHKKQDLTPNFIGVFLLKKP